MSPSLNNATSCTSGIQRLAEVRSFGSTKIEKAILTASLKQQHQELWYEVHRVHIVKSCGQFSPSSRESYRTHVPVTVRPWIHVELIYTFP